MSIMRSASAAVGVMIGLIICLIWFRFANTNKKCKTEYDERQRAIRNQGYKYAFYTILFYEAIQMILTLGGLELPIIPYAQHFAGIFLGCIVLGVYCIWRNAYWGLNNNRKRYYIVFTVIILLNLIPIVGPGLRGTLIENGQIGMPILNIMAILMCTVLGVTLLIRHLMDRAADSEEE